MNHSIFLEVLAACIVGYFVGHNLSKAGRMGNEKKNAPRPSSVTIERQLWRNRDIAEHSRSAPTEAAYLLPKLFFQQTYLPMFRRKYVVSKEGAQFLNLTTVERKGIEDAVSDAARRIREHSFRKAEIIEESESKTIFLIPRFGDEGSKIKESMLRKLVDLLGTERAKLFVTVSQKHLANDFAEYGGRERKIVISNEGGWMNYEELQPSRHHSGEFTSTTSGSWEVAGNEEALADTTSFKWPFLKQVIAQSKINDQE